MEEAALKRKKIIPVLISILLAVNMLVVTGCDFGRMKKKVVDYWEEQSSEYTAFTKELTAGTILQKTVPVESISEDKFAYQQLDDETRQVYDEILHAVLNHMDKITVSTLNAEVLKSAFIHVSADYGGLFWISGYSYTEYTRSDEVVSIEFAPKYTMDYEQRKEMQQCIDQEVESFLSGISKNDSDYAKAKYVFENLIREVDYDTEASNSQNIISVFCEKKTVCQGYACATLYLLNQLNIPGVIVTGSANGEAHAWNLVLLDGEYYYMDTTWGNSTYLDEESQEEKFVNYGYLAFTTEEMNETHTPDSQLVLPECTSIEDNYYVQEGLYFDEWLPDEIGDIYGQAQNNEAGRASVKFATTDLYEKAKKYFIDQQRLEDYCEVTGNVYYLGEAASRVLTISIK